MGDVRGRCAVNPFRVGRSYQLLAVPSQTVLLREDPESFIERRMIPYEIGFQGFALTQDFVELVPVFCLLI